MGYFSMKRWLAMLLLVLAACYPGRWVPEYMVVPGTLPREQQVKIWRGGNVFRWHAVVYTSDSISGVPYTMSVTCDSCRRAVPQVDVDSIRVGLPMSRRENREIAAKAAATVAVVTVLLAISPVGH